MAYVEKSLAIGEAVLYIARQHWIVYAGPLVALGLGIALFATGLSMPGSNGAVPGSLGLMLLICGVLALPVVWLIRRTTELAITNRKVLGKWGVVSRRTIEQRLGKIDAVQVDQGLVGRMLNYGNVIVHGSGTSATPVKRIADPLEFRRQVENAVEASRS